MRVVLVAVAVLVSLGTLTGLGVVAFGLAGSRVVTDSRTLPAGMRSLTVDTGGIPLPVRLTTDVDAVAPRIDLRMVTRTDNTRLAVVTDDVESRVTLGDSGSGLLWFNGTGEVQVVLPPDLARGLSVTIKRAGSLSADADLDRLIAKIDDGNVTIGGSARLIDVDVRHGDIATSNRITITESFRATSEFGNITVEFRRAPRTTEAIAGGNVTVRLPGSGAYRVRAQSERPNSDTTVTVPETTESSAPAVTARSRSGNVRVTEIR